MEQVSCQPWSYFERAAREGWVALDTLLVGCRDPLSHLRDPNSRVDWDDRARFDALVLRGAPGAACSARLRAADGGAVHVEASALEPLVVEHQPTRGFFAVDLTERRARERQLAVAERMASLGTLAAGVGHEVNNPLTYILMNQAQLLEGIDQLRRGEPVDLDELRELAAESLAGAERVRDIVRRLKGFSRLDTLDVGPVRVAEVLDEAVKIAHAEIRLRDVQLARRYDPEAGPVRADAARLLQVALNLIVNAVQAFDEGGAGAAAPGEPGRIELATWQQGGRGYVCVRDNGCGIAPAHLERVFDPFFTTKDVGKGTGLGLAIAHGIVKELGGDIAVESEPGRGSAFTVALPLFDAARGHDAEAAAAAARRRAAARGPLESERAGGGGGPARRVLVVDDDAAVARAVARALRGHDVVTCASGQEAIELLTRDRAFDVVLCDLHMPGRDGIDVLERVRALAPGLAARFAFMTGGAFTPRAARFIEQAGVPLVEKPASAQVLRERVAQLTASR